MKWLCCTAAMLVREDGDDVDIIAIEQFAAIFEHFDGAFSDWRGPFFESSFASFFDVVAIDVADGGAVVKFMAWGPTASQRSPVPMQPSTGRSLGLRRGAAVDECANQYGAAAVASEAGWRTGGNCGGWGHWFGSVVQTIVSKWHEDRVKMSEKNNLPRITGNHHVSQ